MFIHKKGRRRISQLAFCCVSLLCFLECSWSSSLCFISCRLLPHHTLKVLSNTPSSDYLSQSYTCAPHTHTLLHFSHDHNHQITCHIHSFSTQSHNMAILTTIPPEILLQIIICLPTSSHFLSLSHTSHYFYSFLSTHAKAICNKHITTYHRNASSILLSQYSINGWLVPTHACISKSEQQADRWVSRPSCLECGIHWGQSDGDSSCPHQSPSLHHPGQNKKQRRLLDCLCLPVPCLKQRLQRRKGNQKYAWVETSVPFAIKLTEPGPQYLLFLERYSTEIVVREMMRRDSGDMGRGREEVDGEFEKRVGVYCVQNFLRDVEREGEKLVRCRDRSLLSSAQDQYPVVSRNSFGKDGRMIWGKLAGKLKSGLSGSCARGKGARNGYTSISSSNSHTQVPPKHITTRPLLFGEIARAEEEGTTTAPPRLGWKRGLIWYHANPIISPIENNTATNATVESNKCSIVSSRPAMGAAVSDSLIYTKTGVTASTTTEIFKMNSVDSSELEGAKSDITMRGMEAPVLARSGRRLGRVVERFRNGVKGWKA